MNGADGNSDGDDNVDVATGKESAPTPEPETKVHRFIGNLDDVERFFALHMAPFAVDKNVATIVIPIARRKYHKPLHPAQVTLSSTIFQPHKGCERFVSMLRRYEVQDGVFVDDKDAPIPGHAIVLYATINPMDELKGYMELQRTLNERLYDMARGVSAVPPFNVYSAYKSALHKCPKNRFTKYDVDTKKEEHIARLRTLCRDHNITFHLVVETCNGYHVIISNATGYTHDKAGNVARKTLREFVQANSDWVSKEKSGALVVVPGTYQGGFLTRLVNWH